jgi:hypothetical protein
VRALLVWLGLFIMMAAWALASPPASGPDESGHIMKAAATVRGDFDGTETASPGIRSFQLPGTLGEPGGSLRCYVFTATESAACAPNELMASTDTMTAESGVAAYNPVYYALVGWPSLIVPGDVAVIAMRLVSALLSSALWAITFTVAALVSSRPRTTLAVILVGLTPFAVYLGGLVNPSGAEVSSAGAALVLLVALASRRLAATPGAVAVTTAAAAFLCNLRSISPAILLMILVLVAVSVGVPPLREIWRSTVNRVVLLAGAAAVVFALWWAFFVSSGSGYIPSSGAERPDVAEAFWHTFALTPDYGRNAVGVFGWLDTVLPEQFYVLWLVLAVLALLAGLIAGTLRFRLAIVLAAGATVLVPAILQAVTAADYGYIWQGRYSLPFAVVAIALAALALGMRSRRPALESAAPGRTASSPVQEAAPDSDSHGVVPAVPGRGGSAVGGFALVAVGVVNLAVQGYAFLYAFRRFAIGTDGTWAGFFTSPEWIPAAGIMGPIVLVAGGALCFAAGLWLVSSIAASPARSRTATAGTV